MANMATRSAAMPTGPFRAVRQFGESGPSKRWFIEEVYDRLEDGTVLWRVVAIVDAPFRPEAHNRRVVDALVDAVNKDLSPYAWVPPELRDDPSY